MRTPSKIPKNNSQGIAFVIISCLRVVRMVDLHPWDHGFPFDNTKSPRPENPGKLLRNCNLAHTGTVLKITENYRKTTKNYKKNRKISKKIALFVIFEGGKRPPPPRLQLY